MRAWLGLLTAAALASLATLCASGASGAFGAPATAEHRLNIGETYEFNLEYIGMNAGSAVIEVKGVETYEGKKVYHLVSTAKSNRVISMVYKVDDKVESFIDVNGFFSRKLVKSIREGKYSQDITIYFDQEKNKVREGDKTYDVPRGVQDILSAFFHFKVQKLDVGRDYFIDVYAEGSVWKLQVQTVKRERIRTPAGEFITLKVKPFMKFETIFKQQGDVDIWVTDDARHVPVLMRSKVVIGSVSAVLVKLKKGKPYDENKTGR